MKTRGIMNELPWKERIFSSACLYEQPQIVRSLLPYVGIEERLAVLKKPSISSSIRKLLLDSVDDSKLARALVYTAKTDLSTEFSHFLNRAMNKQGMLLEVHALAKSEKVSANYMKVLEKVIEQHTSRSK